MHRKKKQILFVFLVVILLLCIMFFTIEYKQSIDENSSLSDSDINVLAESISSKWTIMVYLALDNHRHTELDRDLDIFASVGSSDELNIIVLADGVQEDDTTRYFMGEDNTTSISWYETESNTSDPQTIKKFLNLTISEYPAEHYGLFILSDCGSGWQGVCHDGTSNSLISIPVFGNVFKEITNNGANKFDLIGLDMCVTSMLEVAYEIAPYVNYMVATEEHGLDVSDKGPEYVWQYRTFTQNLKGKPDMTPEEFASDIIKCYKAVEFRLPLFYLQILMGKKPILSKLSAYITPLWNTFTPSVLHTPTIRTTLSAINLSKIQDATDAVDELATTLLSNNNMRNRFAVHKARKGVRTYGDGYPKNPYLASTYLTWPTKLRAFDSYIDLYDFADRLEDITQNQDIKNLCKTAMTEINKAVIAKKTVQGDRSHGLSIYFPKHKRLYNRYLWGGKIPSPYEELQFSKDITWDEFLQEF
jgi:hypothetical protein